MFKAQDARAITNNALQGNNISKGQIIDAIRKEASKGKSSLEIAEPVSKTIAMELSNQHNFEIKSAEVGSSIIISW